MPSTPEWPFWGKLRGVKLRTEHTKTRTWTFHVGLSPDLLPPVAVEMRGSSLEGGSSEGACMTVKDDPTSVNQNARPQHGSKTSTRRIRTR
jgi:hypothetical protein